MDDKDMDFYIPSGDEFLVQMLNALPNLSPTAQRKLKFIAKVSALSTEELQQKVRKLQENPSDGGVLFQVGSAFDRIIAWLCKETCLQTAEELAGHSDVELASLLFVELFVRVREDLRRRIARPSETDVITIVAIIDRSIREAHDRVSKVPLPADKLKNVLKYRSVENELMQEHEGRLTDEQLSSALRLTIDQVVEIRRLNAEHIDWNSDNSEPNT